MVAVKLQNEGNSGEMCRKRAIRIEKKMPRIGSRGGMYPFLGVLRNVGAWMR